MAKANMKNIWDDRQREQDRLQKLRSKNKPVETAKSDTVEVNNPKIQNNIAHIQERMALGREDGD